jgi:tRNA(Ile)-lysidine synthase TilS/MesJ
MEIGVAELEKLNKEDYVLIDMRSDFDRSYGFIPNSVRMDAEDVADGKGLDKSKKIIVYCARGELSIEVCDRLQEKGFDAYSLKGGYYAWLRNELIKQADKDFQSDVERSIQTKFRVKILSKFIKAIKEYELIQPNDKIAVCISGGKDSMLMAKLFQELQRYTDVPFETKFIVMDPGYNAENRRIIKDNARKLGIPITIFESDIFESVYNIEKSPCYLCARMRRGYLYNFAKQAGCNKIALGHHYDDVIETILMGILYGAQVQTMMPKLHSTNFEGMELIRPLYLIREDVIKEWRDYNGLHFIQCACKFTDTCTTCNNGANHSKRQEIKELIRELKKNNPEVEKCIFKSVENVNLDTVIAYKKNGERHSFLDDYADKIKDEYRS